MRWVPFLILAYVAVVLQTTFGRMLTFDRMAIGPFGPDVLAILAVFVALSVRHPADAVLAGWTLGMLIDLTTAGGAGDVTRLGPMALGFGLCSLGVFFLREALYSDRALPQMFLAALFVVVAHGFWITVQMLLAGGGWALWGRSWVQIVLSALYTALLMPLGAVCLSPARSLILAPLPSRSRRTRG